ncbi:hypothetical protein ACFVQ4_31770 [Streptomyces laurentii]|uniref:hypothetical protein n=1 Tax=Streptomyces laurentii TaxID=39478 RepID=UPI0036B2D380
MHSPRPRVPVTTPPDHPDHPGHPGRRGRRTTESPDAPDTRPEQAVVAHDIAESR